MVVNANINTKRPKTIENGIAIFKDLDRKIYAMKPAIKQAIAVRVPEGNIPHIQAHPTMKKNNRCKVILLVMPNMIKATPVEAMPIPKFAASLKIEK